MSNGLVVCLIDNSSTYEITSEYCRQRGWTLAQYKRIYPEAILKAPNPSLTPEDIENRRQAMKKKVKDPKIQARRIQAIRDYWASNRSKTERTKRAARTVWQHDNTDLEQKVQEYFETDYQGSEDQRQRTERTKRKRKTNS